jgi:minor extracellular serine protease Vpr
MKNRTTHLLNLLMLLLSINVFSQNFEELKKDGKPSEPTFVYERPENCALNTSFLMIDLKQNKDIEYLKNRYSLSEIDNQVYVGAFLKIDKAIFNKTNVETLGVKLNTEAGNFLTALIPINSLEALFSVEGLLKVEIAEKVHSSMDNARTLTNVNQVHSGTGLPQAYTGNGVIVGVIDKGFDYTHPNFKMVNTLQPKISRVWEQGNTSGSAPLGFNYGTGFLGATDILNRMRDKVDESHGSHVAGIATGTGGVSSNSNLIGVAYNSELVFVAMNDSPTNQQFLDGINYIFNYANQVNKPTVVNMSWNGQVGPHDGTSDFDEMCDNLVGNGKILVGSAGNNGSDLLHLGKTFSASSNTLESFVKFNTNSITAGESTIDIWGEVGKNFSVAVNIYNINTNTYEDYTPYINTLSGSNTTTTSNYNLYDDDTFIPDLCTVQVSFEQINPQNNKPHVRLYINNLAQDDNYKYISLDFIASDGTVNSWCQFCSFNNLTYASPFQNGDTNMTVGELGGTGNSIISVGAYTSKNTWTSYSGQTQYQPNQASLHVLNQIAPFSSKGPTADGRIKPDITAPGNILASSVSRFDSNYASTSPRTVSGLTDGTNNWWYGMMEGTSMSAPMVTGIIALWLQANPNLNVADIKTILQNTADTDSFTGTGSAIPNNTWGRGKIDAYSGIQYINQFLNVQNFDNQNSIIAYPNPFSNQLTIEANEPIYKVEIYNLLGQKVKTLEINNPSESTINIELSELAQGNYIAKVSSELLTNTIKLIKN